VFFGAGLLIVALGDNLAQKGSSLGLPLFWLGLVTLWVPAAGLILGARASRNQRIAVVLGLGIALYIVAILYRPRFFLAYDGFLHQKTLADILQTGRIFNVNSILPVSPLYPGMEVATAALVKLTGSSLYLGGTVVIVTAKVILILALFLLFEAVGKSSWLA